MGLPTLRSGGGRQATPRPGRTFGWPTVLLCLATALLTWSGTVMVQGATTEPDPQVTSARPAAAPPVPATAASQPDRDLRPEPRRDSRPEPRRRRESGAPEADAARVAAEPPPQTGAVQAPAARERLRAVGIEIPALDIDQDLTELAVNGSTLQVPDEYADIGWWRDGPTPGQAGAAVVVGHVDSPTGPAVFYRLASVERGDRIVVGRDDGSHAVFRVRKVALYERSEVPSARVYRARGRPGLNLLTCGGSFDATAGSYTGNVVVYTDLVNQQPPAAKKAKQEKQEPDWQRRLNQDAQSRLSADRGATEATTGRQTASPGQSRPSWYARLAKTDPDRRR